MFSLSSSKGWESTEAWLKKMSSGNSSLFSSLERFGQAGVDALSAATPVDTGETAASWFYEIISESDSWSIVWGNNHVDGTRQIAVLLQYGHGTRQGGYVEGRDYMNPALRPIFDQAVAEGWKVVMGQ